MRPHVVWFGEAPLYMDKIAAAIERAQLFVSIGTSGSVYPAAGFVGEAKSYGIPCTELNLEPSENAFAFDDRRYGRASEIVPAWAREFFA
jgi:NAD-dependent deacetylase